MAIIIAEITTAHPTRPWRDQADDLFARKAMSGMEYTTVHKWLAQAERDNRLPMPADTVHIPLADNRVLQVRRYGKADMAHEAGQVVITKAEATPGQVVHNRIARLRKDRPDLSYDAAAAEVFRQDPDLWQDYVMACRKGEANPRPVTKAQPVTYQDVCQEAERLMAREDGLTKRQAFERLAVEHPDQREFYEAYRRFHLSAGAFDSTTAGETRAPVEKGIYGSTWARMSG
jgi:hypothetical protein